MFNLVRLIPQYMNASSLSISMLVWLNLYTLILCFEFVESKRRFRANLIFKKKKKTSNGNIHSKIIANDVLVNFIIFYSNIEDWGAQVQVVSSEVVRIKDSKKKTMAEEMGIKRECRGFSYLLFDEIFILFELFI